MHAVLDTKPGSIYNDKTSSLYHFPSRYKKILDQCVGDWVIFREPRDDGGRMAYIAHGRVKSITEDNEKASHYYAHITQFEDFDQAVPWRLESVYWEKALRDIETPKVGIYMRGRSVRKLEDKDFAAIMRHGSPEFFGKKEEVVSMHDFKVEESYNDPYQPEDETISEREIVEVLANQKKRDRRFRRRVLTAYSNRCAFTGFHIANAKGNFGLQAAHILSVQKDGPDIISNGIALTHTLHWMFDNHLLALDDEYRLLISSRGEIPDEYRPLLHKATSGILLPENEFKKPSLKFIRMHREGFEAAN